MDWFQERMRDEKLDIVTTDISFGEFCSKGRERNGEGELEIEVRTRKSRVPLRETVSGDDALGKEGIECLLACA